MPAPNIVRAFDARLEVSEGERAVVARINTDAIDRYKTVIDPAGIDLAAYRTNPVVLWNHGNSNDGKPVARAAWIKYFKAERAIVAKAIFLDDEFSDGIFKLYQSETLRAFSVSILPDLTACGSPTPDEIRKRPELVECYTMYRKSELCEFSAVAVPGNAEALAVAVSRGLWLPPELEAERDASGSDPDPEPNPEPTEAELPALIGRTFGEVHASMTRRIRDALAPGLARQAVRDAVDLQRGRI